MANKILDLRKCQYSGANLSKKVLSGALLSEADLSNAKLVEAVLTKASLVELTCRAGYLYCEATCHQNSSQLP